MSVVGSSGSRSAPTSTRPCVVPRSASTTRGDLSGTKPSCWYQSSDRARSAHRAGPEEGVARPRQVGPGHPEGLQADLVGSPVRGAFGWWINPSLGLDGRAGSGSPRIEQEDDIALDLPGKIELHPVVFAGRPHLGFEAEGGGEEGRGRLDL